jgi:hypothetical protein
LCIGLQEVSSVPVAEKLLLPEGYGDTTETLSWESVRAQLAEAKQYWLATNHGGGSPDVVPLDGLWVDDVWYYGGSPKTIHVGTVRTNPNVTMHLADPWRVVVVEGEVRVTNLSHDFAQRLAGIASEKYSEYGIRFEANSYSEPGALHPRRVISWSSFPRTRPGLHSSFRFTEQRLQNALRLKTYIQDAEREDDNGRVELFRKRSPVGRTASAGSRHPTEKCVAELR